MFRFLWEILQMLIMKGQILALNLWSGPQIFEPFENKSKHLEEDHSPDRIPFLKPWYGWANNSQIGHVSKMSCSPDLNHLTLGLFHQSWLLTERNLLPRHSFFRSHWGTQLLEQKALPIFTSSNCYLWIWKIHASFLWGLQSIPHWHSQVLREFYRRIQNWRWY